MGSRGGQGGSGGSWWGHGGVMVGQRGHGGVMLGSCWSHVGVMVGYWWGHGGHEFHVDNDSYCGPFNHDSHDNHYDAIRPAVLSKAMIPLRSFLLTVHCADLDDSSGELFPHGNN